MQDKKTRRSIITMDIIASVAELCKERDELEETVDQYEDWFSGLIGKTVTITCKTRRKTTFHDVEIEAFDEDGWTGLDIDSGEEVLITWGDIVAGRVTIHQTPKN